uniref:RNA-binding protein 48 n=1 Tax=Amphiprion ocellaris TaxID=80972 RepID=A0AAQ5ZDF7_AMPOC
MMDHVCFMYYQVYTINLESRYLMVQGVPAIGVMTELIQLCALYGVVEESGCNLPGSSCLIAAKRHMDEKSFYGGALHVCYVPEYETVEDTRLKLQDRGATYEGNAGETLNISHYSSFPPLLLPPQEHHFYGHKNQPAMIPTEDKMGTLHNVVPDTKQQQEQNSGSNQTSYNRNQGTEHRPNSNQAPAVRFVPRTTHLQNRKRKMEVTGEHSVTVPGQNEPLIGPKLPEPSKLDMEDEIAKHNCWPDQEHNEAGTHNLILTKNETNSSL